MKIYEHHEKNPLGWPLRPGYHVVCLANGIVIGHFDEPLAGFERVPLYLKAELIVALRSLIDRWIDSGRNAAPGAKDTDEPLKRSVYWPPPEHLEPLVEVLRRWNRRHAPDLDILPTGERTITMGKPKKEPPWERATSLFSSGWYEAVPETEREAREIAIYWLQELLDWPDRYRIARCDNPECRRPYYMRERLRKSVIKNGTYCRNCVNAGSAARVKASLERKKQGIVNRAADVWEAFTPSRQYPRKSDWVAMRVSLKSRWSIKGKWITQNQKAIEAEVNRRKDGTIQIPR